jgi:Cu/Ag efflux pump CusA
VGLTLKDLIDAVTTSNEATSGGYVSHGESEFVVRGRGYLRTPQDSGNTVVHTANGTPVLIRNVAQVVEAYTPRRGAVKTGILVGSRGWAVDGTGSISRLTRWEFGP